MTKIGTHLHAVENERRAYGPGPEAKVWRFSEFQRKKEYARYLGTDWGYATLFTTDLFIRVSSLKKS
jgi:hypothetical protein